MPFHSDHRRSTALFILLLLPALVFSQERKRVEILQADDLVQTQNIANAQRLIGNVIIRHEAILLYCDSAYTYEGSNRVDAFGRVHINQADTVHLYAQKVFYDGDRSFAQAINEVKLENKEITLYTDTLDYDMKANIGYYDDFGKIIDSTNTLTSKVGQYYVDQDMVHFTDSVVGYNDKYTMDSENIRYNTKTEIIFFEGPTTIRDSVNTLYAEDGWYNTQTGEADLKHMPRIYNETQLISASQIQYNKITGDGLALGSVHLEDYQNRSIVKGNRVKYNDITEEATVSDSAVFISYNEADSLYLHADSLFTMPDSVEGENIVKAYYGVRFYRTDVQGICDSMIYFTKDSTVELHDDPVIWSGDQQLSAQRIELVQHAAAPDEMHLFNKSFIIAEQDSGRFDQIKGKNMIGYIINGKIENIDVDGNGQTLYYARENNEVVGLNRSESSNISIRFVDGKINRINFMKQPTGDLKPLSKLGEGETRLPDFKWLANLRPTSKDDIFRQPEPEVVKD